MIKNRITGQLLYGILLFSLLAVLSSCPPFPSQDDINLLNDRSAPVIIIESPGEGAVYSDRMEIKGHVFDKEGADAKGSYLPSLKYSIIDENIENPVTCNIDGSFLVAFMTTYFSGEIMVRFTAIDLAGNTGSAEILLRPDPALPSPSPTTEPLPTGTQAPTPLPGVGTFWFEPGQLTVSQGESFVIPVYFNSGTQMLAAYGIDIIYNSSCLSPYSGGAYNGISAGADGFLTAVNANTAGCTAVSGFDVNGVGPGTKLHVLYSYWIAIGSGTARINITVNNATDPSYSDIGVPNGVGCTVIVQ